MGSGLEPVDGGLGEERIGHQPQPVDRLPVRGRHRGCGPMAFDDELVDISVERVEGLEGELVDDQQVDAEQLAHLDVVAVVESAGPQAIEEPVAAFEVHAVTAAHGDVAQGCRQEVLPTPTGARSASRRPPRTVWLRCRFAASEGVAA
jgi:hypothetical protein